jgi:hypothetical protein
VHLPLADIHAALAFTYRGLPHLNFPCPAARLLTHLVSDHCLLIGTAPSTFADLDTTALEELDERVAGHTAKVRPNLFGLPEIRFVLERL